MLKNTIKEIIKCKSNKNYYKILKKELNTVQEKDINFLMKEEFCINGVDYLFYPIIIDIELEQNGCLFMVGLYLPLTNKYFSFIFDKNDSDEYISWIKDQLINVFIFFEENKFINYKDEKNKKIYPILVGHNILNYDFVLLFNFLYINNDLKSSYNEIEKLSNIIFNNDNPYVNKNYKKCRYFVNDKIKTFFCLDTLSSINSGEARSLFRFKTDIFFNMNCEETPPLEFDLNTKVFKSDIKAVESLCEYNLNDLYYNYKLIFYSTPKNRLKSRCLLYKNLTPKSVSFPGSINTPDSIMNTAYIAETCNVNRKINTMDIYKINIYIEECVFLFNYTYSDYYLNFYKSKNLYKLKQNNDMKLKFKNIELTMGIGGLHSATKKVGVREKLGFEGTQLTFASSNENFLVIILDFQSFYVNIILKLLDYIQTFTDEKKVLKELNNIRLDLKKKKDPNDIIFKVSTLAYTGSLNDNKNRVFFPKLYLSMTLNGQLLCLELLEYLSNCIEKVIEVNTDGVVIYIKKSNYKNLISLCDEFENNYGFKIDTRETIKYGLFFTANKKIIVDKNSNNIIKGFKNNLSFDFLPKTLIHWMENNINLLNNFKNNKEYKLLLYKSLWDTFCSITQNDLKNKNIKNYLSSETILKTKLIVYFSKKPIYFGGLPSNIKTILAPYPIKNLNFKKIEDTVNIKNNIINDLDFSTYWFYFTDKISSYFLYNIENDLEHIKPITLNESHFYLSNDSNEDLANFYLKNKKIFFYFDFLSKLGFVVFMKKRDKQSFTKTKMIQTDLVNTLNLNRDNFYKYMFKNYTYGMLNGVAIAVNLKESWVNSICCIDFDGVEWFFKKTNFNENYNIKQKEFLNFLLCIKENGFLIFSSMTNTPFDRFKVFFKLKNKPKDLLYKEFKIIHNQSDLNFDFNIEDLSSIVGSNLFGQQLLNKYDFKSLIEIDFESYNNFFEKKSEKLFDYNYKKNDSQYKDLLVSLFDERSVEQRTLYNALFQLNKKINIFDYNKYDINKDDFNYIFVNVVKKQNINKLNLEDNKFLFEFYKFEYSNSYKKENIQNTLKNNKKVYNKNSLNLKINKVNESMNFFIPSTHFINNVVDLEFKNYEFDLNDFDKVKIVLDEIFTFFNYKYNTTFIYSEIANDCVLYHSNCCFKEDNGNNKQVTAFINKNLNCNIHCYHNSCCEEKKYKNIENNINKNLYSILLSFSSDPFVKTNNSIGEVLKSEY